MTTPSSITRQKRTRAAVLAALPGSCNDIAAASGLEVGTVQKWVRLLRDESEIHIGAWQRAKAQGGPSAVYVRGPGEDARIEPLSAAPREERLARLREIAKPRVKTVRVAKKEPAAKPARKKRQEARREARIERAMTAPRIDGLVTGAILGQRQVFALAGAWA